MPSSTVSILLPLCQPPQHSFSFSISTSHRLLEFSSFSASRRTSSLSRPLEKQVERKGVSPFLTHLQALESRLLDTCYKFFALDIEQVQVRFESIRPVPFQRLNQQPADTIVDISSDIRRRISGQISFAIVGYFEDEGVQGFGFREGLGDIGWIRVQGDNGWIRIQGEWPQAMTRVGILNGVVGGEWGMDGGVDTWITQIDHGDRLTPISSDVGLRVRSYVGTEAHVHTLQTRLYKYFNMRMHPSEGRKPTMILF